MARHLRSLSGEFLHVIYTSAGAVGGVLLRVDSKPVQIVLGRHDKEAAQNLVEVKEGQIVELQAKHRNLARAGKGTHAVHRYHRLVSVDGARPAKRRSEEEPVAVGVVARLNFSRHGAPNGVVLDTGDFVHMKPAGFSHLKLAVGAKIKAMGKVRPMKEARGRVVEAERINGKRVS